MNPRLEIYIGFNSPSIIKYLEPMMGDMFKTCFAHCHADETVYRHQGRKVSLPEEQCEIT